MNSILEYLDEFFYIKNQSGEYVIFHQVIVKGKLTLRPKKITSVCSERAAKILIDGLQSGKISENLFNE